MYKGRVKARGGTYKPETLHIVSRWRRYLCDIANTRETTSVLYDSVFDKSFEHVPTPFAVDVVAGYTPHV